MLRRFYSASSSLPTKRATASTSASIFSLFRFQSSSSSSSSTPAEKQNQQEKSSSGGEEPSSFSKLLKTAKYLDDKCSRWTLTQQDMKTVIQGIHDARNADDEKGSNNNNKSSSFRLLPEDFSPDPQVQLSDSYKWKDETLIIPYMKDTANAGGGASDVDVGGIHVPFIMSSFLRCVMHYPFWHTMSVNATKDGKSIAKPDHLELRRTALNTPHRDILVSPFGVNSLPVDDETPEKRIFVLGSEEQNLEIFRKENEQNYGSFVTPKIAGYELFQLAQMLTKSTTFKKKTNLIVKNKAEGTETKTEVEETEVPLSFDGISLDPRPDRFTVISADESSKTVCQTLACDAAMETNLVLAKWLVEESEAGTLTGHKALFVGQSIKSLLERGTYYVLQDKTGAAHLFTSMHYLLRYRQKLLQHEVARKEFESRAPWSIGRCDGSAVQWNASAAQALIINPHAPGDEDALQYPAHGVRFSPQGIEQMQQIAKSMPN